MNVLMILLACAVPIRAEGDVRDTMRRYVAAWLASDPAGVMGLLTEDAVLVPNEKPAYVGAGAIRDYWFSGAGVKLTRFDSTIDQVILGSDMATVRGTQVIEWTSKGERWRTKGNYLTVLRKQPAGWRIALQMAGNTPAERIR